MTIRVLQLPALDELQIPYVDIHGLADGPHLTVIAGVHGAEYASISAVREFARELDPATISGRITAVPLANPAGFWARAPFVVPDDGKNLNRCFPGDPAGSHSERLAHALFTVFMRDCDAVLDLHAGDLPEALEPFSVYEESQVQDASRDMALAYGLAHIVRQPRAEPTVAGSLCAAASDAGIPAIIAEVGQNGLLSRGAIERHLAGVRNVARHLGVLPGDAERCPPPQEHEGWRWLRTPVAGWWEPTHDVGVAVEAGELLGTVSELLGPTVLEVHAPERGVVLFQTTSPAVLEDGLLLGLARA